MQIPRMEAVDYSSVGLRENGVLSANTPVTREQPDDLGDHLRAGIAAPASAVTAGHNLPQKQALR